MGGAVSAGEDNDELIDNLVDADYIWSPDIELVFRAVDRADYYADDFEDAYKDLPWKHGNLHLSAPCIYSEVMESLKLQSGQSFLNLGSGTGYLSTMAGLILGINGTNHGIELQLDVVEYALEKLADFKRTSNALEEYEFCEPTFVVGNCLLLDSSAPQYDRVYCGAACPPEHENYMKNLIKVGGILVMPINDQLLQICRKTETTWDVKTVLPVSFASLVLPTTMEKANTVKLPDCIPLTLQEICRSAIRVLLRSNIEIENSDLKGKKRRHARHKRSKKIRHVIHFLDESDDSVPDEDQPNEDNGTNRRPGPQVNQRAFEFINQSTGMLRCLVSRQQVHRSSDDTGTSETLEEDDRSSNKESSEDSTMQIINGRINGKKLLTTANALSNCDSMDTSDDDHCASIRHGSDRKRREYVYCNHESSFKVRSLSDVSEQKCNRRSPSSEIASKPPLANEASISSSLDKDCTDSSSKDLSEDEVVNVGVSYMSLMRKKISNLPLPFTLKVFLNYNRPF